MALGQISPARLEGEALRRWYLRSPAEIEGERREAAEKAYNAFFSPDAKPVAEGAPRKGGASAPEGEGFAWSQVGEGRWKGARMPLDRRGLAGRTPTYGHVVQLAARTPTDFWDDWTPCNTMGCHGRPGPSASPGSGGQSPLPPIHFPRSGGSDGSGGRSGGEGSQGKNPRQCTIQYEIDSGVCRSLPRNDQRSRCWSSAAKREAHCIKSNGEVGFPSLETW